METNKNMDIAIELLNHLSKHEMNISDFNHVLDCLKALAESNSKINFVKIDAVK